MSAIPLPPSRALRWIVPGLVILAILPWVVEPYQTTLFSYGLVMAIAALGFNLLLGYTGLLSFGHSAYFGVGAYAVAMIVKYFKITSLEVFIVGASWPPPSSRPSSASCACATRASSSAS